MYAYTDRSCFMAGMYTWKTLCKLNTKFPFKRMHFLGVRGLSTSSYIAYDYTTSGHMDLYSIYLLYIKYIYISIQFIYLFIYFKYNKKSKRLTSMVVGTVDSDRNVVTLLLNHFNSWLSTPVILLSLSWIVHMLIWAYLTLWCMSKVQSPFSSWLITYSFSSILLVLHRFFSCIALGDVGLHFSLIFIPKPMIMQQDLHKLRAYITNIINPFLWLMGWEWCHFLLVSNTKSVRPHFVHAKSC